MSDRKCDTCNGQGWTAQHDNSAGAHDWHGNCLGSCPVQVPCDDCYGIGRQQEPDGEDFAKNVLF